MLLFNLFDTPNTGSNDDTGSKNILCGEINGAVLDGLDSGGDSELREAVHAFAFTLVDVLGYVKVFYLTAEFYGVLICVEGFYRGDATFALA